MAIRSVVWACIVCGREASLRRSKRGEVCEQCGTTYRRSRGAKISVQQKGRAEEVLSPVEVAARLPDPGTAGTASCAVEEWVADKPLFALGRYLGRIDTYGEPRTGQITLDQTVLRFTPSSGEGFDLALPEITAVQPGSRAIQIKTKHRLVSFHFDESSAMLWEERLHNALSAWYAARGLGEVVEFLPRICTPRKSTGSMAARIRNRLLTARALAPAAPWQYRLCAWIARTAWHRFGGGVDVTGLDHVPRTGPFIVVVNHQSYLEPMLVPAVVPRPIHAMAKSTQFTVAGVGWLMAQVFAFPVRRFEIDPNAVRYAVNRLSEGYGLMIFPEGERSWDGQLQPLRLGVARLALKAGIPVIPCRVDGAYEAWPRWASRPHQHQVRIAFKPPLPIPPCAAPADCEAQVHRMALAIAAAIGPSRP